MSAPYLSTFSPARIARRASLWPTPIVRVTRDRFAVDRHRVAFAQRLRDDEAVVVRRQEHEAAVRIFHT